MLRHFSPRGAKHKGLSSLSRVDVWEDTRTGTCPIAARFGKLDEY
jgi:hypothetical protein